jgi:flagellar biosynthesis/type III secretory pathway M-ring protein FliF/YscJ
MDAKANPISALTGIQKILVAVLIAIVVLTAVFWALHAPHLKMVSILGDQTLDESDIGPIERELELANVPHSVESGKIMVPADRRAEVLAKLMFARVLPVDTHTAFDKMHVKPDTKTDAADTLATARELSDIISRFPGVRSAKVVLNTKNEVRIEGSIPPSATVLITTNGVIRDKEVLARAAADGVANAVAGLAPSQVSVVIDRGEP